jgi:hypothetical protein
MTLREIVKDSNLVPGLDQLFDGYASDVTRPACYQHFH